MSLKAFHVVFVVCSVLLSLGLLVWAALQPERTPEVLTLGLLGLVAAVALVAYGAWFLKKLKGVSYL